MRLDKEEVRVWLRSLLLTLLAGVTIEAILFFHIRNYSGSVHPAEWKARIFGAALGIGLVILIGFKVKRLGSSGASFFSAVFFFVIFSFIFFLIVRPSILKPRYFALKSLDSATWEASARAEADLPLVPGHLYGLDDPDLRGFQSRPTSGWGDFILERRYRNQAAEAEGFLFWQAGFASGYSPPGHQERAEVRPGSVLAGLGLFLTVGFLSLLEILLRAVTIHFPLGLSLVIAFYLLKRKHLWFL